MADSLIEKIHIDEFLTLVEGLEVYKSDRQGPPEPDFWAETNLGLIGIEHTGVYKKINSNGINPIEEKSLAQKILDEAKKIFEGISNEKLQVNVAFRSSIPGKDDIDLDQSLKKFKRADLANELVQFVLQNNPLKGEMVDFRNPEPWSGKFFLSEVVEAVGIWNEGSLNETFFGLRESGVVPSLEEGSIFFDLLVKKNRKPKNYKKHYDQIWLVMVTNAFDQTMDFKLDAEDLASIRSTFDRVFIYRYGDQKYHELQKITG